MTCPLLLKGIHTWVRGLIEDYLWGLCDLKAKGIHHVDHNIDRMLIVMIERDVQHLYVPTVHWWVTRTIFTLRANKGTHDLSYQHRLWFLHIHRYASFSVILGWSEYLFQFLTVYSIVYDWREVPVFQLALILDFPSPYNLLLHYSLQWSLLFKLIVNGGSKIWKLWDPKHGSHKFLILTS